MERRAVLFLMRKRAQNQTDIFWPKNVGLKNVRVSQTPITLLRLFNDFERLSIREVARSAAAGGAGGEGDINVVDRR